MDSPADIETLKAALAAERARAARVDAELALARAQLADDAATIDDVQRMPAQDSSARTTPTACPRHGVCLYFGSRGLERAPSTLAAAPARARQDLGGRPRAARAWPPSSLGRAVGGLAMHPARLAAASPRTVVGRPMPRTLAAPPT